MASITFDGIDAYRKQLEQLGKVGADKAIRYAIYPAAKIVADEIKSSIPVDTGDLRASMILTSMEDDDGFISTEVKFVGYDRKGVPNQLKARALERGRSSPLGKLSKHPFIKPAVSKTKKKAEGLMQVFLDRYITDFMNRK